MQFIFCGEGCMSSNKERQAQEEIILHETPRLMLTRQSSWAFLDEFSFVKNHRCQTKQTQAGSIRNYNTSSFSHKNSRVFSPRSVITDIPLDRNQLVALEIYEGELTPRLNNSSVMTTRQKKASGSIRKENWAETVFKGFKIRNIVRSIIVIKKRTTLLESNRYLAKLESQTETDDLHEQIVKQIINQQQQQRKDIVITINSLLEDPHWIQRISNANKVEENRKKRIVQLKQKKVTKSPVVEVFIEETKVEKKQPVKKFTFLKKGLGLISSSAREPKEDSKHEITKKGSDTKQMSYLKTVHSKIDCWTKKKQTIDEKMNLSQETIPDLQYEEGFDKLLSLLDEKNIEDIISDQAGGEEDTKTLYNIKTLMHQINEQMSKESQIPKRKYDFEFEKMLVQLRREYHSLFV